MIELDDAFVGGKQKGKRVRGAAGKKPIIVACKSHGTQADYLAIEVVERIYVQTIAQS